MRALPSSAAAADDVGGGCDTATSAARAGAAWKAVSGARQGAAARRATQACRATHASYDRRVMVAAVAAVQDKRITIKTKA